MSAYLPCRVCGLETDVSPGYIGTFVKCVLCRHTHTSRKELSALGKNETNEEKIKAFISEVEEDVVIRAAERRVKKKQRAAAKAPPSPRLSTPPPEEIY